MPAINDGFAQISESEYQAIDKKWFGLTSVPFYINPLFRVIVIIGAATFLVALVLFIWNRTLQRMVRQKTGELWNAFSAIKQVEEEIRELKCRTRRSSPGKNSPTGGPK
ncbi:hypothetical protein JCM17380_34790 [Desulfosporosinus burensis]